MFDHMIQKQTNHLLNEIPFESHDIQMHSLITHDEFIEVDL